MTKVDIVILSNGPGEVTTWVRPVVQALRQKLGFDPNQVRISVVLSPCPNASGKEADIARSYPEVDRVQAAEYFWQFLLWGKTFENWDWRKNGVVVFLGGDQFFPVVIGKRLGYRTVVYAEWKARWYNLIDRFGVMKESAARVPLKYAHKFTVVGDLMQEANGASGIGHRASGIVENDSVHIFSSPGPPNSQFPIPNSQCPIPNSQIELIGILPGSKAAKLTQGVPLTLAIAEYVHARKPQTKFVIAVAPTLEVQTLASYADSQKNPFVKTFGFSGASLILPNDNCRGTALPYPYLKTATGLSVELWTKTPAHDLLSQCSLCLTTVGANTAELGALAVPMIILLPMQQLDAMRSWDGLPGLLVNLPGVGSTFAKLINWVFLKRKGLLAWPNIWAQSEVVPELVGQLQPLDVGEMVLDFLSHPEKLDEMRASLRSIRGTPGAAHKLATLVQEELCK